MNAKGNKSCKRSNHGGRKCLKGSKKGDIAALSLRLDSARRLRVEIDCFSNGQLCFGRSNNGNLMMMDILYLESLFSNFVKLAYPFISH